MLPKLVAVVDAEKPGESVSREGLKHRSRRNEGNEGRERKRERKRGTGFFIFGFKR